MNATSSLLTPPPSNTLISLLNSIPVPSSWSSVLLPGIPLYLLLVRSLRYQREKAMRKKFGFPDRASLARMRNDEAQQILKYLITLEFPWFWQLSLQFALFKTYGFESMSKLIVATKNLADPQNSSKRYEDTVVLIGEFLVNPPTSKRALQAISRMNFLHNVYASKGLISNSDFLYVLSVFITEPIRFMALYEWRPLNEMEVCALGVFWRSMGDAMGMDFGAPGGLSRAGQWKDGIDFVDDISTWAKAYEIEHMKPARSNRGPAGELVPMLIYYVPRPLKGFATEVVYTLMGERVREAFMFPEPSIFPGVVGLSALWLRQQALRYLCLPRPIPKISFSEPDPKTGRIHHDDYLVHPFYNAPTFWNRWGPMALVTRLLGGIVPDSNAKELYPNGYLIEEVGPTNRLGRGSEEMKAGIERLEGMKRGGCPFG